MGLGTMPRMKPSRPVAATLLLVAAFSGTSIARGDGEQRRDKQAKPLVIAHRGASGYRPEHTLASYELGARLGADYVEPDLVSTKDGVLVARHENEISGTTDVSTRPEFAARRTTKVIHGVSSAALDLGVDGLFSDNPDTGVRSRGGGKAGDGESQLLARAILASDACQPGPPSGAAVAPNNGVTPPFPGQPIPGFSAVLDGPGDTFYGMPDNGYGAKNNSADLLLRLYRIRPDFKTSRGGSGGVEVLGFIQLRDPDGHVNFPLTRPDRLLTGADFDLESVRRTEDGDLWFGEEFGPFLLHTDSSGRVLEVPIPLPGVQSPQSPFLPDPDAWSIPASRGFEPMALSTDGPRLYPMLEARCGTIRTHAGEYSTSSRFGTGSTRGAPGTTAWTLPSRAL
jgi:hypothetical protein